MNTITKTFFLNYRRQFHLPCSSYIEIWDYCKDVIRNHTFYEIYDWVLKLPSSWLIQSLCNCVHSTLILFYDVLLSITFKRFYIHVSGVTSTLIMWYLSFMRNFVFIKQRGNTLSNPWKWFLNPLFIVLYLYLYSQSSMALYKPYRFIECF